MSLTADVRPGDWFVVDPAGELFRWIELGERLIDSDLLHKRKRKPDDPRWGHCGVATRWDGGTHTQGCPQAPCTCGAGQGVLMCVEAEPGGAVERPWRWEDRPHLWSTGTGLSSPAMATAALGYVGTGYAAWDYVAIAAHRYRLHPLDDLLKARIASSRRLICSQLTDRCAQDKGIHLFNDQRWPGYVTPLDLGLLLDQEGGTAR